MKEEEITVTTELIGGNNTVLSVERLKAGKESQEEVHPAETMRERERHGLTMSTPYYRG